MPVSPIIGCVDDKLLRLLAEIEVARSDPEFAEAARKLLDPDQRAAELGRNELRDVTAVEVLRHYHLRLTFGDGLVGDVDLTSIRGLPDGQVFQPLGDPGFFSLVRVDHGTIAWPGDIDMASDVLYEQAAAHPA
jgi:hypothetical protein